jgi:hypothetical protein
VIPLRINPIMNRPRQRRILRRRRVGVVSATDQCSGFVRLVACAEIRHPKARCAPARSMDASCSGGESPWIGELGGSIENDTEVH